MEEIKIPVEFQLPQNLVSHYATNMLVQREPYEYIISFFEVRPPALLGTKEEREAQLARIESVPAVCVARIVVAKERMARFVQVLQEQVMATGESHEAGDRDE